MERIFDEVSSRLASAGLNSSQDDFCHRVANQDICSQLARRLQHGSAHDIQTWCDAPYGFGSLPVGARDYLVRSLQSLRSVPTPLCIPLRADVLADIERLRSKVARSGTASITSSNNNNNNFMAILALNPVPTTDEAAGTGMGTAHSVDRASCFPCHLSYPLLNLADIKSLAVLPSSAHAPPAPGHPTPSPRDSFYPGPMSVQLLTCSWGGGSAVYSLQGPAPTTASSAVRGLSLSLTIYHSHSHSHTRTYIRIYVCTNYLTPTLLPPFRLPPQ